MKSVEFQKSMLRSTHRGCGVLSGYQLFLGVEKDRINFYSETYMEENLFTDNGLVGRGLKWPRFFGSGHPYEEIVWEIRTAKITKGDGTVVFEQRDVEVPNFWS